MHKYEDYIDIVDGDEMKEDEIDCIVCGALEKLKAHDDDENSLCSSWTAL